MVSTMNPPRQPSMCSLSAATRWRHSGNCFNGKDRKLSFLVTLYILWAYVEKNKWHAEENCVGPTCFGGFQLSILRLNMPMNYYKSTIFR